MASPEQWLDLYEVANRYGPLDRAHRRALEELLPKLSGEHAARARKLLGLSAEPEGARLAAEGRALAREFMARVVGGP